MSSFASGGQEARRSGGQEVRRSGQKVRRSLSWRSGQKVRRSLVWRSGGVEVRSEGQEVSSSGGLDV